MGSSGSWPFGSTPFLGVLLSSLIGVNQHPFLPPPSFPPALPLQHWAHCQPGLGSHLSDLPLPGQCKFASDNHHHTSSFPYGCEVVVFFSSGTHTSLGSSLLPISLSPLPYGPSLLALLSSRLSEGASVCFLCFFFLENSRIGLLARLSRCSLSCCHQSLLVVLQSSLDSNCSIHSSHCLQKCIILYSEVVFLLNLRSVAPPTVPVVDCAW